MPSGLHDQRSDDVFEAVGGVAGQPHTLTATAQVLTVRPLHVDVSLLLLTAAASLRTSLAQSGETPSEHILGFFCLKKKKKDNI